MRTFRKCQFTGSLNKEDLCGDCEGKVRKHKICLAWRMEDLRVPGVAIEGTKSVKGHQKVSVKLLER